MPGVVQAVSGAKSVTLSAVGAGHGLFCRMAWRANTISSLDLPAGFTLIDVQATGAPIGLGGNGTIAFGYIAAAAGGETTITSQSGFFASATSTRITVVEVDGPLDLDSFAGHGSQASSTSLHTPALTPTAGLEAIIFASAMTNAGFNQPVVNEAGWTSVDPNGFDPREQLSNVIVDPTAGAYQFDPTCPVSGNYAGLIAAFVGAPPPPEPPDTDVVISDPEDTPITTLDRAKEKLIRVEYNEAGSFRFAINKNDEQATEATLARGNIIRFIFEQIHAEPLFEGLLDLGDFTLISKDGRGGEMLVFGGPGSLSMLRYALLWHESGLGIDSQPVLEEKAWQFTDANAAGNIVRRLLLEAQDRGALTLVNETFGQFVDTDGATWDEIPGTWSGPIGRKNLEQVVEEFCRDGQFDVRMDPGFLFNAWKPGTMGRDLTSTTFATGKVRFEKGVNIATELKRGMHGRQWATDTLVENQSGYVVKSRIGVFPYRSEDYLDKTDLTDDAPSEQAAASRQETWEDADNQLTFEIPLPKSDGVAVADPLTGLYLPGPDWSDNGLFWVGDLVTVHTGTGDFDYDNETFMVYAITIWEDEENAQLRCIIELNAPITPDDGSLPARPAGTSSVGTNGGSSDGNAGAHAHNEYVRRNVFGAKGDLLLGTADDTYTRKPVGTDYASLRALASDPTGVDYLKNTRSAGDPTTGDDSADGYDVGSRWWNTTSDEEFVCLDASVGAAFWASTTAATGIDWGEDADIVDQDFADVADAGVLNEAARADHRHGMPADPGSSGMPSGTSNPGSPSTGDLFFRTDLGMIIYYDGTRWVSEQIAQLNANMRDVASFPISAPGSYYGAPPIPITAQVWYIGAHFTTYVTATNNGANYWIITPTTGGGAAFNTSADGADVLKTHYVPVGAAVNTADNWATFSHTKNGAPGSLWLASTHAYRYIVT